MQTAVPNTDNENAAGPNRPTETGFPSPATDHIESPLNLQEYVVRRPASTYFARIGEEGHPELGLFSGDIVVVDRSLAPRPNSLVIAELHGEHKICRLHSKNGVWLLEDGAGKIHEVSFRDPFDTPVWGRITHVIHQV